MHFSCAPVLWIPDYSAHAQFGYTCAGEVPWGEGWHWPLLPAACHIQQDGLLPQDSQGDNDDE